MWRALPQQNPFLLARQPTNRFAPAEFPLPELRDLLP